MLLSTFLDPIPNTVSTVSGGSGTTSAQAAAQSATKNSNMAATAQTSTSSPPPCPSTSAVPCFSVSGLSRAGPGVTLLAYVVIIQQPSSGPQFTFASNPFSIQKQSRRNLLQDFDLQPLDSDVPYPACNPPLGTGLLCGEVEFNRNSGQGFGPNDFMNFTLALLKGGTPVNLGDVCGAKAAFIYSNGYTPVSNLGSGSCSSSSPPTTLIATSLSQDPMTAPQIGTVPSPPPPGNTSGCSPLATGLCANPMTTGFVDINPLNGLEGGALCYSNGIPIQCP
jgi:hypothetical protein